MPDSVKWSLGAFGDNPIEAGGWGEVELLMIAII